MNKQISKKVGKSAMNKKQQNKEQENRNLVGSPSQLNLKISQNLEINSKITNPEEVDFTAVAIKDL